MENAVRGLAQFDLDFLTVHGDPNVVRAAKEGASGKDLKILAVTILTSLDRNDLDANLIKPGEVQDLVTERAGLALAAGADGVIASPQEAGRIRALPEAKGRLIVTPGVRPHRQRCWRPKAHCNTCQSHHRRRRSYRDWAPDLASRRSPADHTRHLGQPALIPPIRSRGNPMQLRHRRFGLESSQSVFLKQYYSGERTLDQYEPDQLVGPV